MAVVHTIIMVAMIMTINNITNHSEYKNTSMTIRQHTLETILYFYCIIIFI